jgi:hypothetical protein
MAGCLRQASIAMENGICVNDLVAVGEDAKVYKGFLQCEAHHSLRLHEVFRSFETKTRVAF